MAITAKPYFFFLYQLATGVHNFNTGTYKIALLTNSYTPDYIGHDEFSDVSSFQPSGGGYSAQTLTVNATIDSGGPFAGAIAQPVTWASLTTTIRYAVVYLDDAGGSLVGLIDFGADKAFAAEPFQLSFPNGLVSISSPT